VRRFAFARRFHKSDTDNQGPCCTSFFAFHRAVAAHFPSEDYCSGYLPVKKLGCGKRSLVPLYNSSKDTRAPQKAAIHDCRTLPQR